MEVVAGLPHPLGARGFRVTCYYYRKAYYRSFVWSPPACAVPDARTKYCGESRFPLILQNIHRYFFYLAILILLFLWWDAILAFSFPDRLRDRRGHSASCRPTWSC